MMRNEVTFFDVNPIGGVLTLLSEDAQQVEDAFGQIKGRQISNLGQFLIGIIMAFVYCWQMALIGLCTIPIVGIVMGIVMPGILKQAGLKFKHTAQSMTIAEESLSSIRTIKGCNREDVEFKRFMKQTKYSEIAEQKIGMYLIAVIGAIQVGMWGVSLLNLWFGAQLVDKGKLDSGDLFSVFGFNMFGTMGVIMLQGTLQGEQKALAAGARILKLTDEVPSIPFEGGDIIEDFKGHIEFRNVSFKYPTRDVYVLRNCSFEIKPNQMGALVGHSGSGKSTCVQLLERFYDVEEGIILLDGKDIRSLDPRWLHRVIGLVQQEPLLFLASIEQNIKYGTEHATHEQVVEAAEVANARRFVEKLDNGFDQHVGERGGALSGGQRQRIAIARAVIKNPVILITDEATSALDAESEKKVQLALDKVMENRTAVVVAHRLSTVKHADIIYVFDTGEIKEIGNHESLLEKQGFYYNLVKRQLNEEDAARRRSTVDTRRDENTSSSS
jgi:ABC-type multidrug transport system fused ATPase/permease subunit